MKKVPTLILSLALPFLAGAIGSLATLSAISTWYTYLNKPSFSPPNWIFSPVWTLLYLMMGIALYRIWVQSSRKSPTARFAVKLFLVQLMLNTLWSLLFFGLQNPLFALIDIIILFFLLSFTIIKFEALDKLAAYLLLPYLYWIGFATILNLAIWILN